jgi:type IV pilus assembly protein PilM
VDSISVGLDIGSSAIRAAEISLGQGRRALRRYGQVGLPHGYVVDGDIVNIPAVSAALRRLWTETGFSTNKVIVGVSGPRVFIRQADVPPLSHEDLRSSLKFDSQELIPIPMEDACFDFAILDPGVGGHGAEAAKAAQQTARILLVAAHRDLLRNYLATLKGAGLEAIAIDPSPMALMRVAPPLLDGSEGTGLDALVSVGAELTTVAVREDGVPRFIRSLTIGGNRLTESLANAMHLDMAVAENLKRGAVPPDTPQLAQANKAISSELRDLAEDVRGTVDFFLNQSGRTAIDRLLITGGAAQTRGLATAIAGSQIIDIRRIDPFALVDTKDAGLTPDQLTKAGSGAATAVGLALWSLEPPLLRLTLLPEEVAEVRRARRVTMMAATGVAVIAGILSAAGVVQVLAVKNAQDQVKKANSQVAALTADVSRLQIETSVHGKVAGRTKLVVTALQGDVDWVRVLGQLAQVMPPNVTLASFSGARTTSPTSASSATSGVGTATFTLDGTGGLPSVSAWLLSLQHDPDFAGTWIGGIATTGTGQAQFTLSTNSMVTPVAESNRAAEVKP